MIGNGMPIYAGYASQHGHGLGNIFGGIVRSAIPFIMPAVKDAGKQLLREGVTTMQKRILQDNTQKKPTVAIKDKRPKKRKNTNTIAPQSKKARTRRRVVGRSRDIVTSL